MTWARRARNDDQRKGAGMNRNEFIIATAIILFAAFLLGWFASWLVHRLGRASRAELGALDSMAQQLHDAEQARDRAIGTLETREADLVARLGTLEAEARATQDALTEARSEIEELRAHIERKRGPGL